ncbi:MAG TPA: amidinotransferase, partial [Candidatus Dormibacteraeota bacterium]|nr:amidinotransferase [Candidatus Dormibacteraeota bacterium]
GSEVSMARLLMCPPAYYGIEYEINPWMDRRKGVDRERAIAQWGALYRTLTGPVGAAVALLDPMPGLPDMVFTANAGLVVGQRFIPSRFRYPVRAGEEPYFRRWFEAQGYEVLSLPEGCLFEGAGDALACGETLYAGYHFRSHVSSHRELSRLLSARVLSLELSDPRFYHLDTCFCPLGADSAIYYPAAFDRYARQVLAAGIRQPLLAAPDDAARFGCNAVVVDRHVVLNAGCAGLRGQLEEAGYTVHEVDLSEFLKSGGAAKCLTLRLD